LKYHFFLLQEIFLVFRFKSCALMGHLLCHLFERRFGLTVSYQTDHYMHNNYISVSTPALITFSRFRFLSSKSISASRPGFISPTVSIIPRSFA